MSLLIPLGLFLLYLVTPHASDSEPSLILGSISAIVIIHAIFRLCWNWKTARNDSYQIICALLDFFAISIILVGYAFAYEVPVSVALKSPTANIFFVYLTSRIVLFNGAIILKTGILAAITWGGLVLLALADPKFDGRTSSFVEYLTSFKVLLGAEVERLLQFGIITAILYTFIYIARRDAPTGFLRRPFFLQSISKFLSMMKNKGAYNTHALIEIRTTNITDIDNIYSRTFKLILELPIFKKIRIVNTGRISHQSIAIWIEYPKGSNY